MSVAKRLMAHKRSKQTSSKGVQVSVVDGEIQLYMPNPPRKKEPRFEYPDPKGSSVADAMLAERGPRGIPYRVYLKTTYWKRVRRRTLARDKGLCVRCKGRATEVHHVSYERLGREDSWDVVSLCSACHEKAHEGSADVRPKRKKERSQKEKDRARELCRKARRASKGSPTYSEPEVLKILDVWAKKTASRGEISMKRVMREMGYCF